jgi:hypothetical protein
MSSNEMVDAAALWLMNNAARATNAIFLIVTLSSFAPEARTMQF